MNWTEIIIKVNTKDLETASSIIQMCVSNGLYIEDYSNLINDLEYLGPPELIDDELLRKDTNNAIIHVYFSEDENPREILSFIKSRFDNENIDYEIDKNTIKEEDWANNWKKYFKPLEIGDKLIVKPSWEELNDKTNDRVIINIDPGMAFGSGTHESTKLCLAAIEKYIKQDDLVLDIGCGSGILSVAALLLNAKHIVAVDVDSVAIKSTKENMELNNISSKRYTVYEGNLLSSNELKSEISNRKYDVVLTNIVADIIIEFIPIVKELIRQGGYFITSGIVENRKDDVVKALCLNDFEIIESNQDKVWTSLICRSL